MTTSLIHNEQTKLLATALNTTATSSFGIGVIAPIAAAFYNVGGSVVPVVGLVFGFTVWLSIATVLHIAGRQILRRLRP